jgi:LruC domain-containing protein
MTNPAKFLTSVCLFACASILIISCKDTDDFLSENGNSTNSTEANTFDFSTTKNVDLIVDYSDYNPYGPVLFSVYNVNPLVNEGSGLEFVDESIEPIFSGYTDDNGKFDATISLPAYAKVLHIVTGNFKIGLNRSMTEVVNGEAKVVVAPQSPAVQSRITRAPGEGTSTNDLSNLYNLNYMINSNGSKNEMVYKDWLTPLGNWNSATGRPYYLLEHNAENIAKGLVFSDEDMNGLYKAACDALNSGTECKETYRAGADMTITEDSEVSITALGSMTCWNSSLGYYFYNEKKIPQKPEDLNIIMLFPNTQDGQRDLTWNYQNNIGTVRGDVVKLMYYPNIAKNGNLSGATTVFPKGTKIGFILKPNAWSMLGDSYCSIKSNGSKWNKKMNIWASSTEGLSFANANVLGQTFSKPNPNGEARTAKFAYTSPNGQKFAIISMEDACDDKDYDDLLFALNPANVFSDLPEVQQGKTHLHGVYAFEDLWPERGDYDMNDVVVDFDHELDFKSGKVQKEIFSMTTYQNTVTLKDGLALKLKPKVSSDKYKITLKRLAPGETTPKTAYFFKQEGDVYYIWNDVTKQLGYTYIFTITYNTPQLMTNLAEYEPFIWREQKNGKHWEMHLPFCEPTDKMDYSLFGTKDDKSDPSKGIYFVRNSAYPFAFYLANAKADNFMQTILKEGVNKPISAFYPEFLNWSTSSGVKNPDWYLHPNLESE